MYFDETQPNVAKLAWVKGQSKYGFATLEIGKSFYVPCKRSKDGWTETPLANHPDASTLENMRTHCSRHNRLKICGDKIFKCALWPDNPQFIQVWRVS